MNNLSILRKQNNLTQKELAEKVHTSFRSIQSYETGTRDIKQASYSTLEKIAIVLNCKIEELL